MDVCSRKNPGIVLLFGGGGGNLNEPYRSTLLHYNYLFS